MIVKTGMKDILRDKNDLILLYYTLTNELICIQANVFLNYQISFLNLFNFFYKFTNMIILFYYL